MKVQAFIFSTYVEVFLERSEVQDQRMDFLHVCGGVSQEEAGKTEGATFSPRMWRCFYTSATVLDCWKIFSTYVEVFL